MIFIILLLLLLLLFGKQNRRFGQGRCTVLVQSNARSFVRMRIVHYDSTWAMSSTPPSRSRSTFEPQPRKEGKANFPCLQGCASCGAKQKLRSRRCCRCLCRRLLSVVCCLLSIVCGLSNNPTTGGCGAGKWEMGYRRVRYTIISTHRVVAARDEPSHVIAMPPLNFFPSPPTSQPSSPAFSFLPACLDLLRWLSRELRARPFYPAPCCALVYTPMAMRRPPWPGIYIRADAMVPPTVTLVVDQNHPGATTRLRHATPASPVPIAVANRTGRVGRPP